MESGATRRRPFWHTGIVFLLGGMPSTTSFQPAMSRASFWLAGGSTVAIMFSIAASQILLGLALAALLLSGTRLRLPPIGLPLALFVAGTIVSLLLSGD